jgi:hypothetical protein
VGRRKRRSSAALQIIPVTRLIRGLRELQENLKKSIDTLLGVQLNDAPSPAFATSAAGETTRVKIKTREKIEKSVDALLAFPLQATFHNLPAVALAKADQTSFTP